MEEKMETQVVKGMQNTSTEIALNTMEDLFRELLGYEEGLRNSQARVLDAQSNVRLFERHVQETMDKIKTTMGENNEVQFFHEGVVVDFYYSRPGVSVDVPDIEAVPEDYIKVSKVPDKAKIKERLSSGLKVNWASLKPGESKLTYKFLKH